jgi:ribose transport system substrate-binding protein
VARDCRAVGCGGDDDDGGGGGNAAGDTAAEGGGSGAPGDPSNWCGDKEVTLGIYDGGGLNDWSKESLKQVKLEAEKCPAIKKQIVVNAGFDPQKGVSGLRGLIAQGANAIVAIPDSGVCAELPAMRQATQRNVTVVPWAAAGCGKVGTDYEEYVDWDVVAAGRLWTEWMAERLKGKGNILWLGGPAGNPVDSGEIKGMYEVLKQHPDIKVLDKVDEKNWPVTNWDPAEAQKVTAALLAKYKDIDGIISSYGSVSEAGVTAFENAGRKVPPIATLEQNALACDWKEKKGTKDEYDLATISNRNWLGRIAVRKAVAAVNGKEEPGKPIVELPLIEDSTDPDKAPVCNPEDPAETFHSNELPAKELESVVYGG